METGLHVLIVREQAAVQLPLVLTGNDPGCIVCILYLNQEAVHFVVFFELPLDPLRYNRHISHALAEEIWAGHAPLPYPSVKADFGGEDSLHLDLCSLASQVVAEEITRVWTKL